MFCYQFFKLRCPFHPEKDFSPIVAEMCTDETRFVPEGWNSLHTLCIAGYELLKHLLLKTLSVFFIILFDVVRVLYCVFHNAIRQIVAEHIQNVLIYQDFETVSLTGFFYDYRKANRVKEA